MLHFKISWMELTSSLFVLKFHTKSWHTRRHIWEFWCTLRTYKYIWCVSAHMNDMHCSIQKNNSHALFAHTYKTHKFKGIGVKLNINFSGFISNNYLFHMQGYQNDSWANSDLVFNDNLTICSIMVIPNSYQI